LSGFNSMLGSLCPLHRVAAFGAPDDRRIVIHLLCVDTDQTSTKTNELPPEVLKGFRRSPAVLGRLVLNLLAAKRTDTTVLESSQEISEETKEACDEILEFVFQEVYRLVDESLRRSRIQDLYGATDNLGIVSPSEWPNTKPSETMRKEENASVSSPAPSVVSSSSSEESDEAESVSTSSGSDEDEVSPSR
jgi:hypothetical protein